MSKSILIVDTPENYYDCRIRKKNRCGGVSSVRELKKSTSDNLHKPDWCPLIKIPNKIEHAIGDIDYYKAVGFNNCIDQILSVEGEGK